MSAWRLGSVPFLNERPLTAHLDGRTDVTLIHRPPGPLAAELVAGAYDAALIPVAEQLRHALRPIGDLGIACRGPVASVQLWHDAPLASLTRATKVSASAVSQSLTNSTPAAAATRRRPSRSLAAPKTASAMTAAPAPTAAAARSSRAA